MHAVVGNSPTVRGTLAKQAPTDTAGPDGAGPDHVGPPGGSPVMDVVGVVDGATGDRECGLHVQ